MRFILNSILFFIIWNLPLQGVGQGDGVNLQKYWYYKTRFNNDFIKIGKNPGENVPFNQRGLNQIGYPTTIQSSNALLTGDASAQLGIYIGVLAKKTAISGKYFRFESNCVNSFFVLVQN